MQLNIMVMSGPDDGLQIELAGTKSDENGMAEVYFTIGRREACDVCVPFDTSVSRLHAKLVVHHNKNISIIDEKSRNGTFVGRQRVKDVEALRIGELFRVGNTWLRIQSIEEG